MTIQDKIHWSTSNWKLDNLTTIYMNNNKAVFGAKSVEFGNVILKVNENTEELISEYNMLKSMSGLYFCKVFAIEINLGIMLEEQLIPGTPLREVKDVLERIDIFLNLFMNIHKTNDPKICNTNYLDWLRKANEFCINQVLSPFIMENMQIAYNIGVELFDKYEDRVLLHGDLHHDNILMNKQGTYCIIDPKGVGGPKIFDLPRFILNELVMVSYNEWESHINHVILTISKVLGYPTIDVKKLFFLEVMLSNVWNIEDGESIDEKQILLAHSLLNK